MSLREIRFPPKDEPLRADVRLMGELVGDVLREQGPEWLFPLVERVRTAAIFRREGAGRDCGDLETAVRGLSADRAGELVRAFSTYFQVVNLAEQVHRIRRGRSYLQAGDTPQGGSLADAFRRVAGAGVGLEDAIALLEEASLEPVFTAHPTEATRRVVLEKQQRMAERLLERLSPERTPGEEATALARIRAEVTTAWQTEEQPRERPTIADEREHVLFYVAGVLYRVLPAFLESVEAGLADAYGDAATPPDRPLVRVASWVGGDMDGNPNVDERTIRETLARHRTLILSRYLPEVDALSRQLSQSSTRVAWSSEIEHRIAAYTRLFPEAASALSPGAMRMGYRVLLHLMGVRLQATRDDRPGAYVDPAELVEDLVAIERSLEANRGRHAGLFTVRRLRRRAEAFGFHLATLDVRQDAREHRDVLAALLGEPGWTDWSAADRTTRLRELIEDRAPVPALPTDAAGRARAERALTVFQAIADGRARYGSEAVGPFVISMAQGVDDVLSILLLARWGGLVEPDGSVPLDVAPLFETVPDLREAGLTLGALYADPCYGPHLERRGRRQIVMIGYSDSSKDGGIASARWSLQKAQQRMADVSDAAGARLTVFHGRGGTVSRGGGKVYRAVEASPRSALSGRLRLTEQGEVIDAKYGLPSIALRNLERMLGAILLKGSEAFAPGPREDPSWAAIAEVMAEAGRAKYRALVYDEPRFYEFFRAATPVDVIERMSIGSRPAARRAQRGIQDLRAIPWVFAWTQTRATLPGWYGMGTGLEAAIDGLGRDAVAGAVRSWPFLAALVDDVEMVLAKSDLEIAERYVQLAPESTHTVFRSIEEEFARTERVILDLTEADAILDGDPTLQRSIRLRNPYVDPMNLLQVDLLARWRASDREDEALFEALLASVQGIARGLKNTG